MVKIGKPDDVDIPAPVHIGKTATGRCQDRDEEHVTDEHPGDPDKICPQVHHHRGKRDDERARVQDADQRPEGSNRQCYPLIPGVRNIRDITRNHEKSPPTVGVQSMNRFIRENRCRDSLIPS